MHHLIDANARRVHDTLWLPNLIGQSLSGLKCLKELSLSAVHIDDQEVQVLLSNFPLLQRLSIAHSERLRNVLIVGHSEHKLKHLNMSYASNLNSTEIGNMINLISLRFYGLLYTYILKLTNVPKLIEFNTSEHRNNRIAEILSRIPSCMRGQLRLLKPSTCASFLQPYLPTPMRPELINIKHLNLEVRTYDILFEFFPLIEACHLLEKLDIELLWLGYDTKFKQRKVIVRSPKKKFPNFTKLEPSGHLGSSSELELVLFIMNNVLALKELIVEPCNLTKKIRQRGSSSCMPAVATNNTALC